MPATQVARWFAPLLKMRLEAGLIFSRPKPQRHLLRPLQALILACSTVIAASSWKPVCAQDLSPRAYLITPLHFNAVVLTYSFYSGSVDLAGAAPITGATGTYSVPILGYYHSFSFLGRSANVNAVLPYAVGNFGNILPANPIMFIALAWWILLPGYR